MTPDTYQPNRDNGPTWDTATYGMRVPLESLKGAPVDDRWLSVDDGISVAAFNSSI